MAFTRLEHQLLKQLKTYQLGQNPVTVAVSGGVDSMALLELLRRLSRATNLKLRVIHVHHGVTRKLDQMQFRNKAWRLVKKYCTTHDLPFYSNLNSVKKCNGKTEYDFNLKPSRPLKSEDGLREFRHLCFQQLLPGGGVVFLAHHSEDLLETRLLQMIRGTGLKGIQSMQPVSGRFVRPLLCFSKKDLLSYLKQRRVRFLNDPSNQSDDPLRNWLRNDWLPQLNKKRASGVENLSNSLQILLNASSVFSDTSERALQNGSIDLKAYNQLTVPQRKQTLAFYMNQLKLKSYSQNHINEVLKRLDSPRKNLNFRLLKCDWTKDARCIKAEPISGTKGSNS